MDQARLHAPSRQTYPRPGRRDKASFDGVPQGRAPGPARGTRRRATVKRVLRTLPALALLLLSLSVAAPAVAEPVQQFDVQLKNVTPQGRFGVVFSSNSFDTSGGPLPALTESSVRIAKGIRIKPRYLRRKRLCQTGKLRLILLDNQPRGVTYEQMLGDLTKIRNRIARRLKPDSLAIVDACRKAYVGKGSFIVDARPSFAEVLPGSLYVFLSPATAKGAIGGFGVMTFYDQRAPIIRNTSLLTEQQPVFTVNLFNDPTPDGRYGYRIQLLPDNFGRLPFSVAELRVESKGIVDTVRTRSGRTTTDFWASLPSCPASGSLPFKAEYRYRTGLQTSTVVQVPCPRYRR